MANIKISDLTAASAVLGTQEFEVNDSLNSKKVTAAQILSYVNANSGAVDLTSAQTISGVKTFSQPVVGSVTGSAASATSVTGTTTEAVLNSALATGTANNTTFLRGDRAWVTPPSGFSGAESITSATNVTLTAQSKQTLSINMTATGRSVVLPDATTMTAGGDVFRIYNNGVYAFNIVASTGEPVFLNLPAFSGRAFTLVFNSTGTGTWALLDIPGPIRVLPKGPIIQEAFNGRIYRLSATRFLSITGSSSGSQASTTNSTTVRVGTLSGSTITWGSPQTFTGSGGYNDIPFVVDQNRIMLFNTTYWATGAGYTNFSQFYRLWVRGLLINGDTVTATGQTQIQSFNTTSYTQGLSFDVQLIPEVGVAYSQGFWASSRSLRICSIDSNANISVGTSITTQSLSGAPINFGSGVVMLQVNNSVSSNGSAIVTFSPNSTSYSVGTVAHAQDLRPTGSHNIRQQRIINESSVRTEGGIANRSGTTAIAPTIAIGALTGNETYLNGAVIHRFDANSIQFISGVDVSASGGNSTSLLTGIVHKINESTAMIVSTDSLSPLRYHFVGVS